MAKAFAITATLAAVAAGALAAVGGSAPATTGVDPLIRVNVKLSDAGIALSPKRVARLQTVWFRVSNTGKKTHNFAIAGHATKAIGHRQVTHLVLEFADRGSYVYRCAVHCKPSARGKLEVYSPLGG